MTEHTKEPWIFAMPDKCHEGIIIGKHGGKAVDGNFNEANARRIVACVNACAGIPTDDLELSPHHGLLHLAEFANELVKQRDELVEAVLSVCCDPEGNVVIGGSDGDRAVLQAALAKLSADKTGEVG